MDFSRITENNGSLRSQNITFAGLTTAYDQTYTYDDLNRIKSVEAKVGAAERRQILAVGVSPRTTRRDSRAAERRQISTIRKLDAYLISVCWRKKNKVSAQPPIPKFQIRVPRWPVPPLCGSGFFFASSVGSRPRLKFAAALRLVGAAKIIDPDRFWICEFGFWICSVLAYESSTTKSQETNDEASGPLPIRLLPARRSKEPNVSRQVRQESAIRIPTRFRRQFRCRSVRVSSARSEHCRR